MKKLRLLIIDDERSAREGLRRGLDARYEVSTADHAEKGLAMLKERPYDLVLTDLRMPGMDGIELVRQVKAQEHAPVCVVLTAYGSVEIAVTAMKAGADDFITKPINLDNVEMTLQRLLEKRRLVEENRELKRELAARRGNGEFVGKSAPMLEVLATIRQVAPARATVLLSGESGTGKEMAAHAIHQLSPRAEKPFVTVHCAALTRSLLESELFGHEKGAFTGASERRKGRFEMADGGTLFLDEIGEIDPSVQVTLLRILETRRFERVGGSEPIEVDVRLVAATNRNLLEMVRKGEFREDLYYRLDVIHLRLPPLRERRDDIPTLLTHFLAQFRAENQRQIEGFTPEALNTLVAYRWPGNVRELRNCVERMVVMARGPVITVKDVPDSIRDGVAELRAAAQPSADPLDLESNEKQLIVRALADCQGNRSAAAVKLGISRRTLHRKLKEFQIEHL